MDKAITKHPCPKCNRITNCNELRYARQDWEVQEAGISGWEKYIILQFLGCDEIFFLHESWCSEGQDVDPDADPATEKKYYPGVKMTRPEKLRHTINLNNPSPMELLHNEIYEAIDNNLPQLAAAGIRTLIDRVAIDATGVNKNFTKNISALKDRGHLSETQFSIVQTILDVGHSVVHRSNIPNMQDVIASLRIVESLMATIYDYSCVAEEIKKRTPQRSCCTITTSDG